MTVLRSQKVRAGGLAVAAAARSPREVLQLPRGRGGRFARLVGGVLAGDRADYAAAAASALGGRRVVGWVAPGGRVGRRRSVGGTRRGRRIAGRWCSGRRV